MRIILGTGVEEVIIAMDNDVPIEEVWNMCEKFYGLRKVSYIRDKWKLLGPKDSPADAPNKIYNFLFKWRIPYDESKHREYLKSLIFQIQNNFRWNFWHYIPSELHQANI